MGNTLLAVLLAVNPGPGQEASKQSCPVTLAAERPFAEPSPSNAARFWYGSEDLAVLLSVGGHWLAMKPEYRYRNKLFWWRNGFDGMAERRPPLVVTGRRLDGEAEPAWASPTTNTHHSDFGGWVMLDVIEFPSAGCWELTGDYRGKKLRFVVLVGA